MRRYQSSYRAVSLSEATARARIVASAVGISRVSNITRLDRVGLPVFASVRPGACEGSLCVNAGKGFTEGEARVGACMEAIEFAFAEPHRANISCRRSKARRVLDGRRRPHAILDLCPLVGTAISTDATLPCVAAEDLDGGTQLVPAELVFFPYSPPGKTYFGSSTNGLASGATLAEATIHALLEVIERDIASFAHLGRHTQLVCLETMPARHRSIVESLRGRGFELALRWMPNEFAIPCFHVTLWEQDRLDPVYVTDGYGCHLDPKVALSRALTEAAQSRLTFIHGARDDIQDRYDEFRDFTAAQKRAYARRLLGRVRRRSHLFDFRTAPNAAAGIQTLDELLDRLRAALRRSGIHRILRVRLTPPASPVVVVRVIVPRLEYFAPGMPRVGRRLARFVSGA